MPLAKRNAAEEKSAMNETLAQLSVNSTERFDGKLTKHLQYQAPGLRSTMVDHGVERLPLSIDRNELKSVTRKPLHYIPWGGDAGGDFYRPPRAAVTQGPTAYDVAMDAMPKANLVELHFNNYMKSGEMSRLPHWVRNHYTADVQQPMAKQDRRASAFREISGATVTPGPYWGGLPGTKVERPGTGAVLTPQELMMRTASYAASSADPNEPTPRYSARQGNSGDGNAVATPGRSARGDYRFGQPPDSSRSKREQWASGVAPGKGPVLVGSPERPPEIPFRAAGEADNLAMRRNDKIVNSSPAKNEQGAELRNAYSGRDAPSRLGPRGMVESTPRSLRGGGGSTSRRAALTMSPMKPMRNSGGNLGGGGSSRGGGAPQSSARGVSKKEAQSWLSEQGSWAERAWA